MDWYDDVFALVFPHVRAEEANARWAKELSRPVRKEDQEQEREDSGFESN